MNDLIVQPVVQYGFLGFSAVLLAVVIWLIRRLLVLLEQPSPGSLGPPFLVDSAVLERPVDEIVVEFGHEYRDVHQPGAEDELLEELRRAVPREPAEELVEAATDREVPVFTGHVVADQFDVAHVADPESTHTSMTSGTRRISPPQRGHRMMTSSISGRWSSDIFLPESSSSSLTEPTTT